MTRRSVGRTIHLIAFAAASLLAVKQASAVSANSCANVDVIGTFDDVSLHQSDYGTNVNGTFRIADEPEESRQPMFNLTSVDCEKQTGHLCRPTAHPGSDELHRMGQKPQGRFNSAEILRFQPFEQQVSPFQS